MDFYITQESIQNTYSELEIIFVINKNLEHSFIQDQEILKKIGFEGTQDEVSLLAESNRLYVGVETLTSSSLRPAIATAMRSLKSTNYTSAKIALYANNQSDTETLRGIVEGMILGCYSFDKYKSKKSSHKLQEIYISTQEYNGYMLDFNQCQETIRIAQITANAVNFTRDIVNIPPDDIYPKVLASIATKVAKEHHLHCTILKPKNIESENMNALLAVARASRHTPRVIHLSYVPANPKAVVSLVGKGLTYDSGGLSLKPSDYMVTMKSDKSGGSAVIGIMKALAQLQLPIEVHGFVGAVENMIGGDAYKPDDVLVAKNGKTVEIRNTDAEGRLVLADVLGYAQQEVKADYIFDMATLTGACVVGVGNYTTGVMGHSSQIKDLVLSVANEVSGEFMTKLDFNRYLAKTLKSEIADISNISNSRYGGAITAGLFLAEFIDDHHKDRWAHLDIAGPAFVEAAWGENPHGASGVGVRTMLRLLEKLSTD